MTFARHLALRGAARSFRARPAQRVISRALASEAQQPAQSPIEAIADIAPSLFAEEDSNKGLTQNLIQAYYNKNTLLHSTAELGSEVEPHYSPTDVYVNPLTAAQVSVELLIASQTHFGHATSLWHPANSKYIFGVREGIHIISSDITAAHLRRAAKVVEGVAQRGGTILFMNSRKGHERIIVRAAELAGACHMFERWIPGTITNGQQILGRCQAKVVDENDQEVPGFEAQLTELPVLKPDLIVCLNPLENYVMLHECGLANIPTIGIIDTDCNPTWVTYPIPANDDSLRSVAFIAAVLGKAGQQGRLARLEAARRGKVTYLPPTGLQIRKKEDRDEATREEQDDSLGPGESRTGRMGHGTNYLEAGLEPGSGTPVDQTVRPTGTDVPPDEEVMSEETKATPGKRMGLSTDRDPQPNVNPEAALNPKNPDIARAQSKQDPARELKQEDKSMEESPSQVR